MKKKTKLITTEKLKNTENYNYRYRYREIVVHAPKDMFRKPSGVHGLENQTYEKTITRSKQIYSCNRLNLEKDDCQLTQLIHNLGP